MMPGTTIAARRAAGCAGVAVVVAVLAPLGEHLRPAPRDGFPLSHFPMFTARRGENLAVTYLRGVAADGGWVALPYRLAGRGGMNQVRKQLRRTARRPARAERLCRTVAERAARRPAFDAVVRVELVTGTFPLSGWFHGDHEPVAEVVHATTDIDVPGRNAS